MVFGVIAAEAGLDIFTSVVFSPRATDDVFDLARFVAATITLVVVVWTKSLLIAIGSGGRRSIVC